MLDGRIRHLGKTTFILIAYLRIKKMFRERQKIEQRHRAKSTEAISAYSCDQIIDFAVSAVDSRKA